jgi:hypothetical protein
MEGMPFNLTVAKFLQLTIRSWRYATYCRRPARQKVRFRPNAEENIAISVEKLGISEIVVCRKQVHRTVMSDVR